MPEGQLEKLNADSGIGDVVTPTAASSISTTNVEDLLNDADEVVVKLADGCTLRSGVYDPQKEGALTSGEYVRLCNSNRAEILFWDQQEWADDPALVMGAIMNAAAGLRVQRVDSPSLGK